jgi:hypothetical protein
MSIQRLVELAEQEFSSHNFPQQAFYQHHASFDDLEESANKGCDFCVLILESFKGSGPVIDAQWPETWLGRECGVHNSMYFEAKSLDVSDVKVCINTEHLYLSERIERVQVFDTLLVQVGIISNPSEDAEDQALPPLSLTLSVPRGMLVITRTLFLVSLFAYSFR